MLISSEDPWPWREPKTIGQRGAFIVIEGLDRAGKTTQVKRLCDKLYSQGHNIKTLRFPGNIYLFVVEKYEVLITHNLSSSFSHASSSLKNQVLIFRIDRTSPIGRMIDSYLQSQTEMDDHVIHLLFSANRWEKA
jgi:dTMP kinase